MASKTYERPDPRAVVEKAMGYALTMKIPEELRGAERKDYAQTARLIISSRVFQHEVSTLVDTFVRAIAIRAQSYEEVRDLRMSINALEMLRERLEEIAAEAERKPKAFDPFESI